MDIELEATYRYTLEKDINTVTLTDIYTVCGALNAIGKPDRYGAPSISHEGYAFLANILKQRPDFVREITDKKISFTTPLRKIISQHAFNEQEAGASTNLFNTVLDICPQIIDPDQFAAYAINNRNLPHSENLAAQKETGYKNVQRILGVRPELENNIKRHPSFFQIPTPAHP